MKTIRQFSLTVLLIMAVCSVMSFAADQAVEGVVRDESGAFVPGVRVTLTNTDTAFVRQKLSDDAGRFVFTNIRTGAYELLVELEGFQPVKMTGIVVRVGEVLSYPMVLPVGPITTEIEILAAVQQVETTTSQLDTVINGKCIQDLPLNGRDPLDLVYLTPGVIPTSGFVSGPSVNGTRFRANNYQLDGLDNNRHVTSGNLVEINVDATDEFRVVRSNPSAEYGRAGGAVIDVVTKSGANRFHGNAFWFHRNESLDATRWEDNALGIGKTDFERNQFGASLGGPILKNRLFFFFNTQLNQIHRKITIRLDVPTADFRDSVINPDIRNIFDAFYPLPNNDNELFPWIPNIIGEHVWSKPDHDDYDQAMLKLDYYPVANHNFSLRYFINLSEDEKAYRAAYPTTNMNQYVSTGKTHSLALDWIWSMSPTMVNNAKVGFNNWTGSSLFSNSTLKEVLCFGPAFNYYAFSPIGSWENAYDRLGTFELKDALTWIYNSHTLKFGFDLRYNFSSFSWDSVDPQYFFGTYDIPALFQDIRDGQVRYIHDFIFGTGEEFFLDYQPEYKIRAWEFDLFIQDDWKVTPNLTLNLGLRYEWKPPHREINGFSSNVPNDQMVGNGYHLVNPNNFFDPDNWVNGEWWNLEVSQWVGDGATIYLAGKGKDLYKAPKTNFAPRLGFSWNVFGDGRTALRGGYGISFDRVFGNIVNWSASQFPFAATLYYASAITQDYNGIYPDGAAYYGHGYPVPAVDLHPQPMALGSDVMVIYNENFHQPYIQTWNLSVQRELWSGNILTVAYAGSAGVHLLSRGNPNQMAHPSPELIQALDENGYGTASIPGFIARYCAQNTQFYRYHYIDQFAQSNYHALQVSFSRRFQQGLQFEANYTWSKALDNSSEAVYTEGGSSPFASDWYNRDYDRGYSSYDVRHIFNTNLIWELPFGPGKWLGTDTTGVLAALIGGWQVNAIITAHSGYPLDYKVKRDTLGTGYTNTRAPARPFVASTSYNIGQPHPDLAGYILMGPTLNNFLFGPDSINLYTPQGDYYRGFFRGPRYSNVDFSLFKEISIPWLKGEEARLQLRLEAFNLFNQPHFLLPSTVLHDNYINLGYSTGTITDSERQIQLGVKFIF